MESMSYDSKWLTDTLGENLVSVETAEVKLVTLLNTNAAGLAAYAKALHTKALLTLNNVEALNVTEEDVRKYLRFCVIQRIMYVNGERTTARPTELGMKVPAFLSGMLSAIGIARVHEYGLTYSPGIKEVKGDKELAELKVAKLNSFHNVLRLFTLLEKHGEVMAEGYVRTKSGDADLMGLIALESEADLTEVQRPLFRGAGVYGHVPDTHPALAIIAGFFEFAQDKRIMPTVLYYGPLRDAGLLMMSIVRD